MKRVIAVLLAALMLVLTGCGEEPEPQEVVVASETDSLQPVGTFTQLDESVFADYVKRDESLTIGRNLIEDGEFAEGSDLRWIVYMESGGKAKLSKHDGQCNVEVEKAGNVSHSVQVSYDGFKLFKNAKYRITFTASCTEKKVCEVRIQYNGGDYHAYFINFPELTTVPQTFSYDFTMYYDNDASPRLAFNLGTSLAGKEDAAALGEYTVTIDDVSLECIDNSQVKEEEKAPTMDIITNQVGFAPEAEKTVYFRGFRYVDEYEVINEAGEVVFTGKPGEPQPDFDACEYVWTGDFSAVTEPGVYRIRAGVLGVSYPVVVGEGLYDSVFDSIVRMFYMQRCGTALTAEYAGDFAHAKCHSAEALIFGTEERIDVSGGWHDAGDYGRYVVSGAKAAADLMLAYEAAPDMFSDETGIPESGNGVPDVLDEVRWELDWMLKMQDAASGGVYQKVTCAMFPGNVMPDKEINTMIVCPITENATGDFAAVMAKASYIYESIDPAFAARCLKAAKSAWNFLMENEGKYPTGNPEGISTGEYPDDDSSDERCWASAELFRATGESRYEKALEKNTAEKIEVCFGWANVSGYAIQTYLAVEEEKCSPELRSKLSSAFFALADYTVECSELDSYGVSLGGTYEWGSNMRVADNAMLMLMASDVTGVDYQGAVQKQLDYLFGVNPMATCFVTGCGTVSPVSTHHRPSLAIGKTMPGMLVGGVNENLEDPYAKSALSAEPPAKCYADNYNSYSCNEVTVYWNSPLVYVLARTLDK